MRLTGLTAIYGEEDWKRALVRSEKSLERGLAPLATPSETGRLGEKMDGLDRMKFTRRCSDSHQS